MEALTREADKLRWGVLATGHIAHRFATALAASRTGRLVAAGSRRVESAQKFAVGFGGVRAHGSYQDLIDDPQVQAIYVATPHPAHREWAIKAAEGGKHVLCEKPLALNAADARDMIESARRHQVFLMEAFMYRCHPQTAAVAELVRAGAIGNLERIEAGFHLDRTYDSAHRIFNRELGGGAILDLGCYPVSFSRMMVGAEFGEPFAAPREITASGRIHPEAKTEDLAEAVLQFDGGITAQVSCGTTGRRDVFARLYGTEGWIDVPAPFAPGFAENPDWIFVHRTGEEPARIFCRAERGLYSLEADVAGDCVARGEIESTEMSHDDSFANMMTLDAWRGLVGVKYPGE